MEDLEDMKTIMNLIETHKHDLLEFSRKWSQLNLPMKFAI